MRQRRKPRNSHASRATTVARLARRLVSLARRVRKLEGHRRRIGFRASRDEIDTEVHGDVWEQDEPEERR